MEAEMILEFEKTEEMLTWNSKRALFMPVVIKLLRVSGDSEKEIRGFQQ